MFDRLWQDARTGDEQRLCGQGADYKQGLAPLCIDWAALSAIAGDHSCSSKDMLESVLRSDWIVVVADVAAQLKVDLTRIPLTAPPERAGGKDVRRRLASEASRAERLNALRTSDDLISVCDVSLCRRCIGSRLPREAQNHLFAGKRVRRKLFANGGSIKVAEVFNTGIAEGSENDRRHAFLCGDCGSFKVRSKLLDRTRI